MSDAYRKIPGIEESAVGALGAVGSELTFGYPRVLDVVALYTTNEIAVLGLELFEVRPDGYATINYSDYDQEPAMRNRPSKPEDWTAYVRENNTRAEKFVRENPAGESQVYVATKVSWKEFCELPRSNRR